MRRAFASSLLMVLALAWPAAAQVDLVVAGCPVASDVCSLGGSGNGNGTLEPGESGTVILSLENQGVTDATNVTAVVTTLTPGVTITQPNTSFGDIASRTVKAGTPAIGLDIAPSYSCGADIVLEIRISSAQGGFSGNCSIVVPVTCVPCVAGPVVTTASCQHADTCSLGGAGNGDGNVDPGETVQLTLSLTNTGGAPATTVTAQVTTSTPGVTITQGAATFGTIAAGQTVAGTPAIAYSVDRSVPCGTLIDFTIDVRSAQGTWTTSCQEQVPVNCIPCTSGPQLSVASCQHADTCALGGLGSGDGNVDPGESVALTLSVTNTGQSTATGVNAQVSSTTPGIVITQNATTFPDIAPGATQAGAPVIAYNVDSALVLCGTLLEFQVDIRSTQGGFTDSCSIAVPASCVRCAAGPVLDVAGCAVTTDDCASGGSGDNNGAAEPGESVTFTVTLGNTGPAPATNVSAIVSSTTPNVNVTQGNTSFGTVAAASTAAGLPTIDFSLSLAAACGTPLTFDVVINSDQGTLQRSCQIAVPSPCTSCGTTGCIVASLQPLSRLQAAKSGATGASFQWQGGGGVEHHLNAVAAKTDLTNCTSPCTSTPRQAPTGMGESRCTAVPPTTTCTDATAISDPRSLLFYQALAACGATGADEGPM